MLETDEEAMEVIPYFLPLHLPVAVAAEVAHLTAEQIQEKRAGRAAAADGTLAVAEPEIHQQHRRLKAIVEEMATVMEAVVAAQLAQVLMALAVMAERAQHQHLRLDHP